ncbi:uncharacterized protein LOC144167696 [Haemaphysalis longicornis]
MDVPARLVVLLLVEMLAASAAYCYSPAGSVSSQQQQQQQQQQQRHRLAVGRWLKSVLPAVAAAPAGDSGNRNTADLDADVIDPVLLASGFAKRQEDDYGHMRFGRSDDYGHMRFGRK